MKWYLALLLSSALIIAAVVPFAFGDDGVIERAMRDEMARSVESLQLEDLERPFFIEYRVDDVHQHVVTASFGALVRSSPTRMRSLAVDVRVGDHNLDNSEFISTDMFRSGRMAQSRTLPLDDDYYALRRELWLTTDETYKIGLELLAKKRAQRANKVEDEPVPDFSHEDAHVHEGTVTDWTFEAKKWEKRIRQLSEVFREFPEIDDSKVELRAQHLVRRYLNSEGTSYLKQETVAIVYATATAYADDGSKLKDYVKFVMPALGDMPQEKALMETVRELAQELTALREAPVIEDYTGPVLFTESAAADLMLQAVGLQAIGQRVPESDMPQLAQMMPSPKLAHRVGKRVASDIVTAYDDPTMSEFGGVKLAGAYAVDDQGMPAQKVSLIDGGTMTSLLMSRRPHKDIAQSNGHARMPLYGIIGSDCTVGNLFVESTEPTPYGELKQQLITICNDEGLEFGLIVRKLNDELLTGVDMDSPEAMMAMFQRQQGISLGAPIALYRVYAADGREELVRGVGAVGLSIRSLRDIAAMGDDARAYNALLTAGGGMFGGGAAQGLRVSAAVPAGVVAPSVLFEEFDLKSGGSSKKKPTLLGHPSFAKD